MDNICNKCNKIFDTEDNFCKSCGEALSENAVKYQNQKKIRAQLEILVELSKVVKDAHTLEIIKSFVFELKNKI